MPFYLLLAVLFALAAFALYLFVRIVKIYRRARRLEIMRNYETILYAALPRIAPETAMRDLFPKPDLAALEEVLLRIGDQAEGVLRKKVGELYNLAGYTEKRIRQLRARSPLKRADAARRLGRIGALDAVPHLRDLLRDESQEVREAARSALEKIGSDFDF